MSKGLKEFDNKECENPGFMCDNCSTSAFCIPYPNGDYGKEIIETCPAGSTCLGETGRCTTASNYECDGSSTGYEFYCIQPGVFPDPFSCKKYHICVPGEYFSYQNECGLGFAYDPLTTLCSIKMVNNSCTSVIPKCEKPLQSGPVLGNPSIFYMCRPRYINGNMVNLPDFFSCPFNEQYDAKLEKCIDPTPPSGIDKDGLCVDKGYYYYPGDCKKYKDCPAKGKAPVIRTCGTYYRFDPNESKCVYFTC
ncbi:uncharacterized protein LOC143919554 [Arctopsyche grandis]|uniref:uncharacterized protein LOC143919554 n=1 Tax=Arctopsyche grandis TaxID=121162 RepID=UPI00406D6825